MSRLSLEEQIKKGAKEIKKVKKMLAKLEKEQEIYFAEKPKNKR